MSPCTAPMPARRRRSDRPRDPGGYQPYGAAAAMFGCRDREVLLEGPAGTGKTRALLEKAHYCAKAHPGMRALLVRKTRESLTESVLVTLEQKVLDSGSPVLIGPRRATRQVYRYPNGSTFVVSGIDVATRIMSSEFDLVLAFEARELTEDDWEMLLSRLRNGVMPYQQALADTNPDAPTHWLNQRAAAGRMTRLCSRHEDNPAVTPQYLRTLERLTGVRRTRLREGRWGLVQGAVYESFDAVVHVIQDFSIPAAWRRIRAIDFGYTNPFVCQWWALDGDGRMYLYREIYRSRRLVEDHARQILEISRGETIEATITDHDAEDRATLARHGVATLAARKELVAGIQAVQARLRTASDGRPRLLLLRDSLVELDAQLREAKLPACTQEEFDTYVWQQRGGGAVSRETPMDAHNHGLDALRYAVAYVDGLCGPALGVRVI